MRAEEVIQAVAELCRHFSAVEVILFGSRAKGTARERSDIDVAVSGVKDFDALAEAKQRDLSDSFVLSGTSAKFSITFDLAWKVMKDILVEYYAMTGFIAGSPREVLKTSYKAELISDDTWIEMLKGGSSNRSTTFPSRSIRNFVKFHLISGCYESAGAV